ncbi:SEC-C domain-containing protein [Clostridium algoriphilum]|uniref:SEC-C metal-binding domain-containing protein n=1 Tax=Clostridium algoriphilum TaxID=198347 RepID=UPI001CF16D61|nr:SEC-C metal-binding domain-containing protein [Clostridium algoriphilum]MCB2294926.1 SEC-C domain-containing protein [Clostridium algoriphilum]
MSLYKEWTDMVVDYVKRRGEPAFWHDYGEIERRIYTKLLSKYQDEVKGTMDELADYFEVSNIYFMGFTDGINDSLLEPVQLEETERDTKVNLKVDFEKLYFNMLDAKADYLYELPQWEGIFSREKRKEIQRDYRDSKMVVNNDKIGRNDACPCGSGKKYKKCCGK